MDYYRRKSWFTSNFVGEVVSSSREQLVLRDFRSGYLSTIHYTLGYIICGLSASDWESLKRVYPHYCKREHLNEG